MNTDYSRCWARYRADCDRGMSKEHLLSKSLFPDGIVLASGFEWCKNTERQVGINALQRKILCQKHNNELSVTDEAAKLVIGAFEAGRSAKQLNGLLFERWLVKTAINLSLGCQHHIGVGMSESEPGKPSPYLIAVAFGNETLCAKMGAYFLFPVDKYLYRAGEIFVTPIQRDMEIGGFLFGLRGQFVFLNLFPGHAPPPIATLAPGIVPDQIGAAPLYYRPASFDILNAGGTMERIQLQWTHA